MKSVGSLLRCCWTYIGRRKCGLGGANLTQIILGEWVTSSPVPDPEPSDESPSIEYNAATEYNKNFLPKLSQNKLWPFTLITGTGEREIDKPPRSY